MAKGDKNVPPSARDEAHDPDFQLALKALLAAYTPVLEKELERARAPEQLEKEEQEKPAGCEEELALANQIFDKFLSEEIAPRLLPAEARELLGPIDRWRWCLRHIRCCIIFGWLVCRGPRTFRAFVYYLHRYWLCVRQALGTPVANPPGEQDRQDFQVLVQSLAAAYKPYLTDQLATVEFPLGLDDQVFAGTIDCFEGQEEAAAIFERFLTAETAVALLGRQAFEAHSRDPFFWFCRCWCLCALRFGCCLARARSLLDVVRCLRFYRRCLRECFRPLVCEITSPKDNECVSEREFPALSLLGIEVVGTATGAFCDHYTLEWKPAGAPDSAYSQAGITYAGSPGPGICGKVNATLGYLDTFNTPVPDSVVVRVCVYGAKGTPPHCCTVEFQIFRRRVWISGIEGVVVENPPGPFDNSSRLLSGGRELSFGTALEIMGHAWVGRCAGKEIKRYTLSYQAGFVNDPTLGPWTQFWQVDYLTPLQKVSVQTGNFDLTSYWLHQEFCLFPPCPPHPKFIWNELWPTRWYSGLTPPAVPPGQFFPVDPEAPSVVWSSQPLPPMNCYSGRYTLRLTVEDTGGGIYHDLQHVWFDNKAIYGEISGLMGVPPCATLNLSQIFNAGNCNVEWPLAILGIAYDEYIIEGDFTNPSDNFGGYCLTLTRQGGAQSGCSPIVLSLPLPIPGPGSPSTVGTNRIGEPGARCASASPPPMAVPPKAPGTLTVMDARLLDAVCAGHSGVVTPPGFSLKRGECCAFYFTLSVWDRSVCPSLSGGRHEAAWVWPICICNDLTGTAPFPGH